MFPEGLPKSEGPGWSECARKGFSVKAVKGNALLFYECALTLSRPGSGASLPCMEADAHLVDL